MPEITRSIVAVLGVLIGGVFGLALRLKTRHRVFWRKNPIRKTLIVTGGLALTGGLLGGLIALLTIPVAQWSWLGMLGGIAFGGLGGYLYERVYNQEKSPADLLLGTYMGGLLGLLVGGSFGGLWQHYPLW